MSKKDIIQFNLEHYEKLQAINYFPDKKVFYPKEINLLKQILDETDDLNLSCNYCPDQIELIKNRVRLKWQGYENTDQHKWEIEQRELERFKSEQEAKKKDLQVNQENSEKE